MDPVSLVLAVPGALKNGIDIFNAVFKGENRKKLLDVSPELRTAITGRAVKPNEAASIVRKDVGLSFQPFLLRVGREFTSPPDKDEILQAIDSEEIWDWTCVVGYSRSNISLDTSRNLLSSYYVEGKPRPVLCTTTLSIFRNLPELFSNKDSMLGDIDVRAVYITGFVWHESHERGNVAELYKKLDKVDENRLVARKVIVAGGSGYRIIDDPMVVPGILSSLVDYIYDTADSGDNVVGELTVREIGNIQVFGQPPDKALV